MIRANGNGNENKGEVMDDKDNSKPTKKRAIANELESLLNRTSNLRHLSALTNHKSKEEPTPLSDYNESTKYSTVKLFFFRFQFSVFCFISFQNSPNQIEIKRAHFV
jgi:hypothetical protein